MKPIAAIPVYPQSSNKEDKPKNASEQELLAILQQKKLIKANENVKQLIPFTKAFFSVKDIAEVPPEVWLLPNLVELRLQKNQIKSLPPDIIQMQKIQILDLYTNKLTSLPKELSLIKSLKRLDIGENPLKELPDWLWEMKNLQALALCKIGLTQLPNKIGQLTNLSYFDATHNKLTNLPDGMYNLNIAQLKLSFNNLTEQTANRLKENKKKGFYSKYFGIINHL